MKKKKICIVDYGVGNIKSIYNALSYFTNVHLSVSNKPIDILSAKGLVLPGVGAFASCIKNLKKNKIDKVLNEAVMDLKIPILGICVGMQLMARMSEENGIYEGLNWIPGKVIKISPSKQNFKVPHVGWNNLIYTNDKLIFNNKIKNKHFYFDHSFQYVTEENFIIAKTNYSTPIVAAIKKNNIVGVQFHPEKSSLSGLRLFKNFLMMVK